MLPYSEYPQPHEGRRKNGEARLAWARWIGTITFAACAIFVIAAITGCAPDPRRYDAEIEALDEKEIEGGFELRGTFLVRDAISHDVRRVTAVSRSILQKGPRSWRVETYNVDGQRVVLEHDDARKTVSITVDDHAPVVARQREDGKLEHDGEAFRDTADGRKDLAESVAGELTERRMADDSVVASFELSRLSYERSREKYGPKLFFTFAWVDVYTNVQAAMNIGANNSINQY